MKSNGKVMQIIVKNLMQSMKKELTKQLIHSMNRQKIGKHTEKNLIIYNSK